MHQSRETWTINPQGWISAKEEGKPERLVGQLVSMAEEDKALILALPSLLRLMMNQVEIGRLKREIKSLENQ